MTTIAGNKDSTESEYDHSDLALLAKLLCKRSGLQLTLGNLLDQLKVVAGVDWRVQIEINDPALARGYRSVFIDAWCVSSRINDSLDDAGKVKKAALRIGGDIALDIISGFHNW